MQSLISTNKLFLGLSALMLIIVGQMGQVQAQNYGQIGGQTAGAVNWHMNQQMYLQRNAPYMFRPATKSDTGEPSKDEDPVVLFSSPDVKAKIVPKVPEPDQIHIK